MWLTSCPPFQELLAEPPYGNCVNTSSPDFVNPLDYYDVYTHSACQTEHKVKFIQRKCGCRMYYDPSTSQSFGFTWFVAFPIKEFKLISVSETSLQCGLQFHEVFLLSDHFAGDFDVCRTTEEVKCVNQAKGTHTNLAVHRNGLVENLLNFGHNDSTNLRFFFHLDNYTRWAVREANRLCRRPCSAHKFGVLLSTAAYPSQSVVDQLVFKYNMSETMLRSASKAVHIKIKEIQICFERVLQHLRHADTESNCHMFLVRKTRNKNFPIQQECCA